MKEYKKHIALFFALLFIVSQLDFAFHSLFECHADTNAVSITELSIKNAPISGNDSFFDDVCDCLLCQQHQITKLYLDHSFEIGIKNNTYYHYKSIAYKTLFSYSYLLSNASLRAPPAIT
ncbi:hypothetical protein [Aquimarina sp. I32.4]|uniref:hypothetical protein n=1 Tax=Aquimarina sp. I32.4 TaxID=2053903 RepID=UPI000CDF283A|nr:hypothetical protein [Aquimarina sp. I32.4]